MNEFREALRAAESREGAAKQEIGLYGLALEAGRRGPGGFAPIAYAVVRLGPQKSKPVASVGEAGFVTAAQRGVQVDARTLAARQGRGAETSYRAVVAQARQEAAAGRARRAADAAALRLPGREAGLAGVSFAPPAGGGAAGGDSLYPAKRGLAEVPGLRRDGSVHGAMAVAEAGFAGDEEAGAVGAGFGRAEAGDAGNRRFIAAAASAPPVVVPADIERALENYFFRQSRLPPLGGAGFNPSLSPVWAGLKIPG